MDKSKKKELKQHTRIGILKWAVISYPVHRRTSEVFFGYLKGYQGRLFNQYQHEAKSPRYNPNRRLQDLWNKLCLEGFDLSVVKTLKYEDPECEDTTKKLEDLRESALHNDPLA